MQGFFYMKNIGEEPIEVNWGEMNAKLEPGEQSSYAIAGSVARKCSMRNRNLELVPVETESHVAEPPLDVPVTVLEGEFDAPPPPVEPVGEVIPVDPKEIDLEEKPTEAEPPRNRAGAAPRKGK